MIKEFLTAATCCIGVATFPSYMIPSQCDYNEYNLAPYHIEKKVLDLSNVTQTIESDSDYLKGENIQFANVDPIKKLEDIFDNMTSFTEEENEYFWNNIKNKSSEIEGIEII